MNKERLSIKGFVKIRLENLDTGEIIEEKIYNFLTEAFKRVIMSLSISNMILPNTGNPYGMITTLGSIGFSFNTGSGAFASYNMLTDDLVVVLLNLPDDVELKPEDSILPILNSEASIDYKKLIGYAGGRLEPKTQYEGIPYNTDADIMADNGVVGRSVLFDAGQATGDFNWIAIMRNPVGNQFRSFATAKNISNYNVRNSGDSNVLGYVIPGCKTGDFVLTEDNEILLFFNNKGKNRWKYNIDTGEMKAVGAEDPAYTWTSDIIVGSNTVKELVVGDYLYVLTDNARLYKIDIKTGTSQGNISVAYGTETQGYHTSMWYDGTNIITSACGISDAYTNRSYFIKVNLSTFRADTTIYNINYTEWGNLPSDFNVNQCCMTKIKDKYYIYNYSLDSTIICTDIMDVKNTIVGVYPSYYPLRNIETDNKILFTFQGTLNNVYIGSETRAGDTNFNAGGLWISDGIASTFLSAAKLSTKRQKGENTRVFINYGYEFE